MRIAYLDYTRGFSLQDFYSLICSTDVPNLSEKEIIKQIKMKLDELKIPDIYLPILKIHPDDLSSISKEVLYGIPITLDHQVKTGFTTSMMKWIKENISIKQMNRGSLILNDKKWLEGMELYIFEDISKEHFTTGRTSEEHLDPNMVMIEASLDDMNPEFYGYIMDKLFALGVNDVYINQVLMKKNRPGQILHILCQEEIMESVESFLFKETTTLGIRYVPYTVHRLERDFIPIESIWGTIQVKIGKFKGEVVQISPEYNDCAKIADNKGIPIKKVYDFAKMKAMEIIEGVK